MQIDIRQAAISLRDKYRIFIKGQETHKASTSLFKWNPEIMLTRTGEESHAFTMVRNWRFFRNSYTIVRPGNSRLVFESKSRWKPHYYCLVGADYYEVFGHRGRKYSVFKNDRQIAWWDKNAVSLGEGDCYTILADNDCDFELLISFCLIIDHIYFDDKDGNMLSIDLGNIGPQVRKFDETWQPKW
ncbi:hypothetical protein ACWKWU_03330 [Chitinophaga lutea]